jgi:hypothetical protein
LLVPLLFLVAVYFPLRSALNRVKWEVDARAAVQRILSRDVPGAVQQSVTIDQRAVGVHLVVVGDAGEALTLEHRLETELAAATGVTPTVSVLAVPDAAALARATAPATTVAPTAPALPALDQARSRLTAELGRVWPTRVTGPLAGWALDLPPRGAPVLTLFHFGVPLGAAGEALVAAALAPALESNPSVRDVLLDSTVVAAGDDPSAWLVALEPTLARSRWMTGAVACISGPVADTVGRFADSVRAALRRANGQATIVAGPRWRFRWTTGACVADTAATG